jgi:ATP-dependent Clp protease adapter protein ClpS
MQPFCFIPVSVPLTATRAALFRRADQLACVKNRARMARCGRGREAARCGLGDDSAAAPVLERQEQVDAQPKRQKQRMTNHGPKYRLYILNDDFNRRERVIEVLLETVDGLSFSSAYASMDEAHNNGKGHVTTVVLELAEHYCETIGGFGILATIEPDE